MENLVKTDVSKWLIKNHKTNEWKVDNSLLHKSFTFNSEIMRRGENGIFIFISGKWKQLNEEQFIKLLSSIFRRMSFKYTKEHVPFSPQLIKNLYLSIFAFIEEFPTHGEIQNVLSDGFYKVISEKKVYKITPKTGEVIEEENKGQYYNFACLKDFDIKEKPKFSPTLKKFFKNLTNNDKDYLSYLQEMIGSCLLNQTSPEPYIYILYGGGKNGKSAFNRMLSYIVFHQISSVEFSNLSEQNLHLFEQKYVNCPSEISDKSFNSSLMKAVTSGDPVSVNEKYKDPRTIIPISKQIASANKLPTLSDSSHGMWRRLQILPFDLKINSSNKIDENTLLKCFSEESEELRKWAFAGLIEFIKNDGEHTKVQKIIEATDSYKEDENNVHQFLKLFFNFIVENFNSIKEKKYTNFFNMDIKPNIFKFDKGWLNDPKVELHELYIIYKHWAGTQGYKPLSVKNFRTKIKEEFIKDMDVVSYGANPALQFLIFSYLPKEKIPVEVIYKKEEDVLF